jgi:hypothetical protein
VDLAASFGATIVLPDVTATIRRWYADILGVEPMEGEDAISVATRVSSAPQKTVDALDLFLRDASIMAHEGTLREGVHYAWLLKEKRHLLYLWVNGVESIRNQWRAERRLPAISPGAHAINAQAKGHIGKRGSYVIATSHVMMMSSEEDDFGRGGRTTTTRGVLLDPAHFPTMDADFPRGQVRTRGGDRKTEKVGDVLPFRPPPWSPRKS